MYNLIPNSQSQNCKKCMRDSEEKRYWDLRSERVCIHAEVFKEENSSGRYCDGMDFYHICICIIILHGKKN